jgi:hypothetical protein
MTLDDLVEQTLRKESNRVNCSLTGQRRGSKCRLEFDSLFRYSGECRNPAVFCIQTKNKPLQTYGALSNSRAP